jgi:hypothetical protein
MLQPCIHHQVFDYPTTSAIAGHIESKLVPKMRRMANEAASHAGPKVIRTTSDLQGGDALLGALYAAAAGSKALPPSVPLFLGVALKQAEQCLPLVAISGLIFRPMLLPGSGSGSGSVVSLGPGGLPSSDAILPVPLARWDRHGAALVTDPSQQLGAQFGSFLSAVELFDAAAFGLSPQEALSMDPQHRLLLESASELMVASRGQQQHSGSPGTTSVGVFMGISWTEYYRLAEMHAGPGGSAGPYSAQGAVLR